MFFSRQYTSTDPHAIYHNSGKLNITLKHVHLIIERVALSARTANWKFISCMECTLFSDMVMDLSHGFRVTNWKHNLQ